MLSPWSVFGTRATSPFRLLHSILGSSRHCSDTIVAQLLYISKLSWNPGWETALLTLDADTLHSLVTPIKVGNQPICFVYRILPQKSLITTLTNRAKDWENQFFNVKSHTSRIRGPFFIPSKTCRFSFITYTMLCCFLVIITSFHSLLLKGFVHGRYNWCFEPDISNYRRQT